MFFLVLKGTETLDEETSEGGKVKEGLSQCMQGCEDCCDAGEQRQEQHWNIRWSGNTVHSDVILPVWSHTVITPHCDNATLW